MILLVGSNPSAIFLYCGPVSSFPLRELRDHMPLLNQNSAILWQTIFITLIFFFEFCWGWNEGSSFCFMQMTFTTMSSNQRPEKPLLGYWGNQLHSMVSLCCSMKVDVGLRIENESSYPGPVVTPGRWLSRSVIQDAWKVSFPEMRPSLSRFPGEIDIPCCQGARRAEGVYAEAGVPSCFRDISAFPELFVSPSESPLLTDRDRSANLLFPLKVI